MALQINHRILMVVYSDYPGDVRVRREAEALVENGYRVDVLCLRRGTQSATENVRGVCVFRINMEHKRGGKIRYIWNYTYFFLRVMLKSAKLFQQHRYAIIHTHNMPEFLVFAQLPQKMRGAKLVVDLHDPMPEVFMSKFNKPDNHSLIRFLRMLERRSIRFVDAVITTNIAFLELFVSRGCPRNKIRLVMNSPQESVFTIPDNNRTPGNNSFTIMYHGTITERYGLDTAVAAMPEILKKIPTAELHVYNDGEFRMEVEKQVSELGLQSSVIFHGRLPLEEIAAIIPTIQVGVVPNHRDAFTEINLPTRIFEYLCLGRPAVAPRTRGILDYFDDKSLHLFEPDDAADLARVVINIHDSPQQAAATLAAGIKVYEQYTWQKQKQNLLQLVTQLIDPQ